VERFKDAVEHWGEGRSSSIFSPSVAADRLRMVVAGRWERMCASPAMARTLRQANQEMDVRGILSAIRVPTLVLHRSGDAIPIGGARYITEQIPGARFVELPGSDHAPWLGDADAVLGEIESFLTGTRHGYDPDRILATILFTDIVASTERLAELGDRRWRDLLDDHFRLARRELERHRGREIKTTGDGLLATFDGPARAIRCAGAIRDGVRQLGIEIRAGLHTGEVEVLDQDLGGIAVHTGARVAAEAGPSEVLVSSTVKDLVAGSGIAFEDRGAHALKGVPGEWRLYAVASI
jgi:class 3 adenylate cyclase